MKKILIAILALVAIAAAEFPAPAGFKWGSPLNVKCHRTSSEIKDVLLCSTAKAPKPIPWVEEYTLMFHKNKLVKVILDSKPTTADITGSENMELYEKIKETLTGKYGEPSSSYENIGRELYEEYDEFYECLAYTGCGVYFNLWTNETDGSILGLEIKSIGFRGRGFVRVAYESPAFHKYQTDLKELEEQATDEGL